MEQWDVNYGSLQVKIIVAPLKQSYCNLQELKPKLEPGLQFH